MREGAERSKDHLRLLDGMLRNQHDELQALLALTRAVDPSFHLLE